MTPQEHSIDIEVEDEITLTDVDLPFEDAAEGASRWEIDQTETVDSIYKQIGKMYEDFHRMRSEHQREIHRAANARHELLKLLALEDDPLVTRYQTPETVIAAGCAARVGALLKRSPMTCVMLEESVYLYRIVQKFGLVHVGSGKPLNSNAHPLLSAFSHGKGGLFRILLEVIRLQSVDAQRPEALNGVSLLASIVHFSLINSVTLVEYRIEHPVSEPTPDTLEHLLDTGCMHPHVSRIVLERFDELSAGLATVAQTGLDEILGNAEWRAAL